MHGGRRHFSIADFTDHDDVWILAESATQPFSERIVFRHLRLHDTRQMIFDRVLDGYYLDARVLYLPQEGVERCRLSGTRRPCVQDHAVRFRYLHIEDVHQVFIEAQRFHGERDGRRVEHAHHNGLRVGARKYGSTYLYLFFINLNREPTVLCGILDVELQAGKEFDACGYERVRRHIEHHHFREDAVETVAHAHIPLFRLEVDVGCSEAECAAHYYFEHA